MTKVYTIFLFFAAFATTNLLFSQELTNISSVSLTFTPLSGAPPVVVSATDPDGDGEQVYSVSGPIRLMESTGYTLAIRVTGAGATDLTQTIQQNSNEFLFLFGFTDALFTSPAGNGNIDNRKDVIAYDDQDNNQLPLGLMTSWETDCGEDTGTGDFRLVLIYQADQKSDTSSINTGTIELDITWPVEVLQDPNAPPCENEEEIITDVTLTFTPVAGGDPIVAFAQDPDGEGPLPIQVSGSIPLMESTEYDLTISIQNAIEGEDITEEIREEDDEHLFFFGWTDGLFARPSGDGNIDNRPDPVNYNDQDENGLPVGLSTSWETVCSDESTAGTFQILLKHQPDLKSATSSVNDGGTDLDLTWNVNIVEDPNAPPCENEEEIITDVTLTFTPVAGGDPIVATAQDPDGEGPLPIQVSETVQLLENTAYQLSISIRNEIEGEDLTEEIREEDEEHQLFFSWTDGLFSNPAGDGNIDNSTDPVNYDDQDENGLGVGLLTSWTTASGITDADFRVVLKHQPDLKSTTSDVNDGGTDLDLSWKVSTVVTSSREQIQRTGLKIYPNPAQAFLILELDNTTIQDAEILIYDQLGRLHARTILEDMLDNQRVPVSQLQPGAYILQIRGDRKTWIKRFIKE